jgi:Glutamate-1-semialdehyde aminotransferase
LALGGAQEKYRVIPDLTAVAKIIGGGFPVGGFGGRADIMAVFDPRVEGHLSQSGTFNGNRISMAAGVASMKLLDAKAIDRLEALSIRLENGITGAIKLLGVPVSLTRAGSLLNVHFRAEPPVDYATARNQYPNMAKLYHLAMLKRGIFCAPRGTLVVSTVMTEKEIDYAVEAFADVMETMASLF